MHFCCGLIYLILRVSKWRFDLFSIILERNFITFFFIFFNQVKFQDEILSKLVGYQPSELWAMRLKQKEVKHIRETLAEIIQNFRKNLQDLHLFMRVYFNVDEEFPIVEELIDMTDANKNILLKKIEAENLPNVVF